jgi:predicted acylesterase/phospholipase RssA/glycosidase
MKIMDNIKHKYSIGLALSGGGAKGFAHIGALRLLEELRIRPGIIAGTSAGAIAAALFADGYSSVEIQDMFTGRELSEFARLQFPKDGLLDNSRFHAFMKRHLRTKKFEDLKIPLVIIATDLDNGCSHEFRTGDIADAVVASCSIPVIFSPVEIDGVHYVDGGLFRNFPVSTIRQDCEIVIGVNVSPFIPVKYKPTIIGIAERSYHYLFRANTVEDRALCDILVETEEVGGYKTFDLDNVPEIVNIGYDAAVDAFTKAMAEKHIPALNSKHILHHHKKHNLESMKKISIYQTLPRLFGNINSSLSHNAALSRNGCGKFSAYTPNVLSAIKNLGITHVWYTGIIEHATQTDYSAIGITPDNHSIVKGKAGSPYAIKDYYDVDPDLAENPRNRMAEFEALIQRTHKAGLKVIIDFVANHVARQYSSDARFAYVDDLGQYDDRSIAFSPMNNFYYIPGQFLDLGFIRSDEHLDYGEFPARATGNDRFTHTPLSSDWYETIKLNYGVDYAGGMATYFDPVPDTWKKMLEILRFWAGKGVDGFRCDMAEMVPVEFWEWAIEDVKKDYPVIFIAEIYNPGRYREYIRKGRFDYLYDKVGMYDTLRSVVCRQSVPSAISRAHNNTKDISEHILHFLENHDEQRIASDFFASDPERAIPALIVSTMIHSGAYMIYNGQELGEAGMDNEGFSGIDGRTTIFDYWSMASVRSWLLNEIEDERKSLRAAYSDILNIAISEPAAVRGAFFDLMPANAANPRFNSASLYSFIRKLGNEYILVAANFSDREETAYIHIPEEAFDSLNIQDNAPAQAKDLLNRNTVISTLTSAYPHVLQVPANGGRIIKFTCLL